VNAFAAALLVCALAASHSSGAAAPGSGGAGFSRPADRVRIGGELSILLNGLPRRDAAALRPRATIDATVDLSPRVRVRGELLAAALVARRDGDDAHDLVIRPNEAWIEVVTPRVDLRAGYGTVVWGRLDELQPTDVVNPIDTARFLLDGRAAARLPVGFARARWFAPGPGRVVVESVLVPWFRRSTFDELDEASSPFNLLADQMRPAEAAGAAGTGGIAHEEPGGGWAGASGGARATVTIGRADVSAAVYRGVDGFGAVAFEPLFGSQASLTIPGRLVEHHERFTMVGGDVEAVAGDWVVRGELAAFVEKTLAAASRPGLVDGKVVEAGAGIERRAGPLRTYGLVLARREWSEDDPGVDSTDVSLSGGVERSFARERYLARVFGVVNPADRSGFLRALLSWDARDDVTVDVSGAVFFGQGDDLVSRFADRDFLFVRLGYHF